MILYASDNLDHRSKAYDLLGIAAREHWGFAALPPFTRGEQGKPYFSQINHHHFNLSHSGALALCGLDDAPLGVDIQIIKSHHEKLPLRVCSAQELAWLGGGKSRWPRFALLWALKESYVKYTGTGLTRAIRAIAVPLPQEGETLFVQGKLYFRIYQGENWWGAVCAEHVPPEKIIWRKLPPPDVRCRP